MLKGQVKKSLRASVYDGICAAITGGLMDQFVTPLAIALQASAAQIGNLTAIPGLVGTLAQLQTGFLRNYLGHRKILMLTGIGIQTACIFGLAITPWLPISMRLPGILALMVLFTAAGALSGPTWGSLMCEYLPLSRRSGYFGWRSRFLGGVTIIATGIGGIVLQLFDHRSLNGFISILFLAAGIRFFSLRFLKTMYEPEGTRAPGHNKPSYVACLAVHRHFRDFILACGLMGFCVNLTAPFLPLYMLRGLHMSYALYTALIMAAQVTMYWMMGRWGRHADRAGNMKIIQITARFLPFTALLWIFSQNPVYLMMVQLASGAAWAGYNLCIGNFVYDSVSNHNRVHATALFNTANGLATFAGASVGGHLLARLPPLWGFRFYTLVLIGFLGRFAIGWILIPKLREVRQVPKTHSKDLLVGVLTEHFPGPA